MKILHLTLKKKWFDMIASGEKKEEYRVMKTYWCKRLNPLPPFKEFDVVRFRHGYSSNAPVVTLEFKGIEVGAAKPEWSDNWQGDVFKIKLGEIIA